MHKPEKDDQQPKKDNTRLVPASPTSSFPFSHRGKNIRKLQQYKHITRTSGFPFVSWWYLPILRLRFFPA